jgi:RimJ/RimL family protein N-acetyltransferase
VVPILETARLRLREQRAEDFARHAAMFDDPEVVRFVGGKPLSREEAWRKLIGCAGLWIMLGYGYWSVERKEDGAYLGQIGFADFKRNLSPSIEGKPEMGWLLTSDAHGKGYASEAVAAAIAWADEALPGLEFTAIIDQGNAPSIRIAQKAGFSIREEARYVDAPILLFRRPAASPAASAASAATSA